MNIEVVKSTSARPLPFASGTTELGFGVYFSEHWFSAKYANGEWGSARVEPYGKIALDPAASVFHYGQALFEGLKAFRRADNSIWLFRPEFNWERMCSGAERLCMQAPTKELFIGGLKKLLQTDERWVPPSQAGSLYIRPTLVGSEGFLGVRPAKEVLFFIILSPVGSYYAEGAAPIRIWVEDKAVRAVPGGLGATKAGANYAASLQAAHLAKDKGFAQVLWLDDEHQGIEEVGTMNVFFSFKNEIITPALDGSILAGGVRDSVIRLLRDQGASVVERRLTMNELCERYDKGDLQEAFGTGTAAVISPIGELKYREKTISLGHKPGAVSTQMYQTLQNIQLGRTPDKFGWMRELKDL